MRGPGVLSVCVAIAAAVAALELAAPVPLQVLDRKLLDFRHVVRGPIETSDAVVVVRIDESSLARVGRWPWSRERLALLVDRLSEAGAAVIGLDIVFDEPQTSVDGAALRAAIAAQPDRRAGTLLDLLGLDPDARFAQALAGSGRVVLGYFLEFGGPPSPTLAADLAHVPELSVVATGGASVAGSPFLREATRAQVALPAFVKEAAGAGHINFAVDPDGLYRRVPVAIRAGGRLVPALCLEILRRYLGAASATLTLLPEGVARLRVGDRTLPVDGAGQLWVDFLGPPHGFASASAADVLDGRVPAEAVAGKIVLVGFTAAGFDEVPTPFAPVVPGVELEATVVDNLLRGMSLVRPWWVVPAEAAFVLATGLVIGLALRWRGNRSATVAVAAAVLALLYAAATQAAFTRGGLALGGVYPVGAIALVTLGGVAFQAATEEREKRKIREAFRHYLNPEVTDLLARDPAQLRLGGERRAVTVLFSDIRGFTAIAEGLAPEVLGELLNEYLGTMTDAVFAHEGLLDKYIGDGLMAFWGAPVAAPDHATRACRAALDMLAALEQLKVRWRLVGLPLIDIRIGINSGEGIVGNFGSSRRFSYTAVGDDVNLASRLEGLNAAYGTRVLVSEETRRAIGEEFVCREIDRGLVKGRTTPVTFHELLGRRADDRLGNLARRAAAFEAASADARGGAREAAIRALTALSAEAPDDGAVASLLDRCRASAEAPRVDRA